MCRRVQRFVELNRICRVLLPPKVRRQNPVAAPAAVGLDGANMVPGVDIAARDVLELT
jgi:hypothetical protein